VAGVSNQGIGVYGRTDSGSNPGVYGRSEAYIGVYGWGRTGVYGEGIIQPYADSYGLYGRTAFGAAVRAEAYGLLERQGDGVYATSQNGTGVYGYTNDVNSLGLAGVTAQGGGDLGTGMIATSEHATGAILFTRNPGQYALVTGPVTPGAEEYGDVLINGNYEATGTKSARVPTNQGDRLMYAQESTINIFSDQGFGKLIGGRALITIDPLFAQVVNLSEPYHVFLTPRSFDTAGLAVGNLTPTSFEVREVAGGKGNFEFSWRIEASRKGYEKQRMQLAKPRPSIPDEAYDFAPAHAPNPPSPPIPPSAMPEVPATAPGPENK
jgi:hypothetical protein